MKKGGIEDAAKSIASLINKKISKENLKIVGEAAGVVAAGVGLLIKSDSLIGVIKKKKDKEK